MAAAFASRTGGHNVAPLWIDAGYGFDAARRVDSGLETAYGFAIWYAISRRMAIRLAMGGCVANAFANHPSD